MNILERGRAFRQWLRRLASRSAPDWRRCPYCGETLTCKWGRYTRRPWSFTGRQAVQVQRHRCIRCQRTYSEPSAWLVRGSWYAREVHRCAIDYWLHLGTSLRKTAEALRSWLGQQERWQQWRPLDPPPEDRGACHLSASTVQRWLDRAGYQAQQGVEGQLAGVSTSGQFGTDGLWARLRGEAKRVGLALVDSVSGVLWPPVVVTGEARAGGWARLFQRAGRAGLPLEQVRGVVSDGAPGFEAYRRRTLRWVSHQRCVFHLWRNLAGELAHAVSRAATGLVGAAAVTAQRQARQELVALVHTAFDAGSEQVSEAALVQLATHRLGAQVAAVVQRQREAARVHRCGYNQGLARVAPEWLWRDFRLRLSRGRNHGSAQRLERAALVWAIYRNFEPAQGRCERTRHYRYPGQAPLTVAGGNIAGCSYLDALAV